MNYSCENMNRSGLKRCPLSLHLGPSGLVWPNLFDRNGSAEVMGSGFSMLYDVRTKAGYMGSKTWSVEIGGYCMHSVKEV